MNIEILSYVKIMLKGYIFFSLLYCLLNRSNNKLLISILVLALFNIIVSDVFLFYHINIAFNNNIYIILSFFLWLLLLKESTGFQKANYFILVFVLFSLFNLFFYELYNKLNTKTFVCGTFIYLLLYIYVCFVKLKQEKLDFFMNNDFILLSSPILFFVGFSLMFGFKNKILNDVVLFYNIKLFDIISNVVNFTFYTLINIYNYKAAKLRNV